MTTKSPWSSRTAGTPYRAVRDAYTTVKSGAFAIAPAFTARS